MMARYFGIDISYDAGSPTGRDFAKCPIEYA
jgi:hypothetical protein